MEEITIEKIDAIRSRTGLSYADAKSALELNSGNVVDTLIYLENNKKSFSNNMTDIGSDILNTVKDIMKKGNVNRIKIKRDNTVLIDIPVNAGIAFGAISLFQPLILAIGTVTAIASKIIIEIERPDGTIEVLNDIIKSTFDQTVGKAKDFAGDISSRKESGSSDYITITKTEIPDPVDETPEPETPVQHHEAQEPTETNEGGGSDNDFLR